MTHSDQHLRGVSAADGTTKAKIERAALLLFAQQGVDGVSTKQIANRAGISEGAIYRHFSGKDDLARSLMLTIHNRLTDMIRLSVHDNDTLAQQIKFIVRHYCSIADDDWMLFQYHILHLHHFPRLSESPEDTPFGAAAELILAAQNRGEISVEDPFIIAAMTLGTVLQTAQAKVFGYISGPLSDKEALFTHAVLSVLGLEKGGSS